MSQTAVCKRCGCEYPTTSRVPHICTKGAVMTVAPVMETATNTNFVEISMHTEIPANVMAALVAALRRFGRHEPGCSLGVGDKCTCGLDDVIYMSEWLALHGVK